MDEAEPPSLIDEAAHWLAALDAGTADPADFEAWRDADPRHAAAFAQVAATWDRMAEARFATAAPAPRPAERQGGVSRRQFAQAASVLLVIGASGALTSQLWARSSAQTSIGERRTLAIGDGARMELNTDTAVEWRAGSRPARIWLEKGQVGLDVPTAMAGLRVYAGDVEVQLMTGRYDVQRIGEGLSVLVLEGRTSALSSAETASAGGKLILSRDGAHVEIPPAVERERAHAWRRGELVFAGDTLASAAREYNRYLDRKLLVRDPAIASLELGGRFTSSDPTEFIAALRASFGIRAVERADGILLVDSPQK